MDEFLEQLDAWHQADKHQQIVEAVERIPEQDRTYDQTGRLARALNNLEDYEAAIRQLMGIWQQGQDDPLWHFRLGYAYYYLDRDDEARAEFERTLELDPDDLDARELLGTLMEPEQYTEQEMDAVMDHITDHFGAVENILHELVSPDIHVDICIVAPTEERPFYTLVTMGMGAHRMTMPEELVDEGLDRAELVICLPPDWELNNGEERWYWPIRWLKILARLPGNEGSWLGWGHTVPNHGPFAEGTEFSCMMLVDSLMSRSSADCQLPDGSRLNFYQVIPLYSEEMQYKLKHGAEELLYCFGDSLSPVVDCTRANVCALADLEDGAGPDGEVSCYSERVEAFWDWFVEQEQAVTALMESKEASAREQIIKLVSQGTSLVSERLSFQLGGDFELNFTAEGREAFYFLLPYLASSLPEELQEKWKVYPFLQGSHNENMEFEMFGARISLDNVRVFAEYTQQSTFQIRFYEEHLAGMEEAPSFGAFSIMLDLTIGEGFAKIYVSNIERADGPEPDMFPLTELEEHMIARLEREDKELLTRPDQRYCVYSFEPQKNEELRYDVITGTSCCMRLIQEYYNDETQLFDEFTQLGAYAGFLTFAFPEDDRDEALQARYTLEDRLEQEILGERGSGEEIGIVLGGSIGVVCGYIDLILFDLEEFLTRVVDLLDQFPYRFYLSPFCQHSQPTLLSDPEAVG